MTEPPAPDPPPKPGSKAGRNEARKLIATFINNVGVGFMLAAFVQPALAYLRDNEPIRVSSMIVAFLFAVIGIILGTLAQRIARRLED